MAAPPRPDWTHLRAFLAVAEHGSLSAAARTLGLTQPTVGRQIAGLEADLGLLLFDRVGRALTLTDTGADLLAHARTMGAAAERLSLAASGLSQSVAGLVRVTASDVFSAHLLPPVLHRIRARAPRLEIDVVAANDLRDILRREADIAVRHVRPTQPDLIARRVAEMSAHLYAARSYLDARGRPRSLAETAQHDFLAMGDPETMIGHLRPLGLPVTRANSLLGSASGMVAWEYVRRGFGIAPMADAVAQAAPEVERVLPDMAPITFPVWLVTHRELQTSRRIRLVYDLLAEAFERME